MVVNFISIDLQDYPVTPTLKRREVYLFDKKDSLKLLKYLRAEKIAILGFEGFYVRGDSIVPEMDVIADFSSVINSKKNDFPVFSVEQSEGIISKLEYPGLYIEFVLVFMQNF